MQFRRKGDPDPHKKWCEANLTGRWEIEVIHRDWDRPTRTEVLITVHDADDIVLMKLNAKENETYDRTATEPAFELVEYHPVFGRQLPNTFAVMNPWMKSGEELNQIKEWCAKNLPDHVIEPRTFGSSDYLITFLTEEDAALFRLRWEGSECVKQLTFKQI